MIEGIAKFRAREVAEREKAKAAAEEARVPCMVLNSFNLGFGSRMSCSGSEKSALQRVAACTWKLSTLPVPGGHCLDLEMKSESCFVFIMRDDRKAGLLFQTLDMTWVSYDRWPQ